MRFFASPAASVVTRPWLDTVALWLLRRYFFPSSRLWAMSRAAEGDLDHFLEAAGSARLSSRQTATGNQ
jgi:hypothetical protein